MGYGIIYVYLTALYIYVKSVSVNVKMYLCIIH